MRLLALLTLLTSTLIGAKGGEFAIDYENDRFTMDGRPFQYVSGSMHYFRCPQQLWRDRLRKMRDAGLNAVSTYIEWSQHEKIPGEYDFGGDLNFTKFIEIAAEEGLYVIVRPGPYICAERDMGGLPPWLLRVADIRLRTLDPRYTGPVQVWMDILLDRLAPQLYGNGGPIILLQVENEYGSYPACDGDYLIWLRDLFMKHVQNKAVLFTTDGGAPSFLKCGKIPGVYATVDFGTDALVAYAFGAQRSVEPNGPLVNSEFYPGWLTHWGEKQATVNSTKVQDQLRNMLLRKANVNFYMFHGGSNFAFTAGANLGPTYQSDITSYDYDAPLTEAGDLTQKYHDIKRVIAEFFPNATRKQTYEDYAPKGDYGNIRLEARASLLSPATRSLLSGQSAISTYPVSFETLGSYFGYVLYETTLPVEEGQTVSLKTNDVRDRAAVLQNNDVMSTLSREFGTKNTTFVASDAKIGLLVENLGRVNYGGGNNDTKGIGNVTVNDILLQDWNITCFPLESVQKLLNCTDECLSSGGFRFYTTNFVIDYDSTGEYLPDTFLDVSSLQKGLVFVNDNNLGRYWSTRGPQQSLYVPGVWLKKSPQLNSIVIFDEYVSRDFIDISFTTEPLWNPTKKRPRVIQV